MSSKVSYVTAVVIVFMISITWLTHKLSQTFIPSRLILNCLPSSVSMLAVSVCCFTAVNKETGSNLLGLVNIEPKPTNEEREQTVANSVVGNCLERKSSVLSGILNRLEIHFGVLAAQVSAARCQ